METEDQPRPQLLVLQQDWQVSVISTQPCLAPSQSAYLSAGDGGRINDEKNPIKHYRRGAVKMHQAFDRY